MLRVRAMSRRALQLPAVSRVSMISRHVSSSAGSGSTVEEPRVLFESDLATRTYALNRPTKLNAVDDTMVKLLRSKIQEWEAAQLCEVIVGTGKGRAFCAGGDIVSVMKDARDVNTRARALAFFKDEFEMNFLLGNLATPYVAIMDGITMGGGVGLSVHAPFRVATENTIFAMPETKIGYIPDVGANHFLSRLDGELGTYLALTGTVLKGRAVYEHGIATHFISSRRIPDLRTRLSSLEKATPDMVDTAIEELYFERSADEPPPPLVAEKRMALDDAFSRESVEEIVGTLEAISGLDGDLGEWAKVTLEELNLRSPTSLKVAFEAVRRGRRMTLGQVLQMEMQLATAYINGASPDFFTGVTAVMVDRVGGRPEWNPETLAEVPTDKIVKDFFAQDSPFLAGAPQLALPSGRSAPWQNYALPSEEEIGQLVLGSHRASGNTGLNLEELLARFDRLRRGKHGVKEKVFEVALRRCRVANDPDRQGCLEWIH